MIAADARADLPIEAGEEPITGWRCWFTLPHELLLRPLVMRGLAWRPRQPLEAVCPETLHQVPADGCKCGVWGVCHPMMLQEIHWTTAPPDGVDPVPGVVVVGQIAMWGHVVQHERGWRSSHAYPTHLYAFTDDALVAEGLRERYGVPVAFGPEAERLRRLLPPVPRVLSSPPSTPTKPTLVDDLRSIADRLPEPLKSVARDCCSAEWRFRWSLEADRLASEKGDVDTAREKLHRAVARGGYYTKSYGRDWKRVLVRQLREERAELVLVFGYRAAVDHLPTRRRLLWLLIARRWREVQASYRRVIDAERAARRTRNKRTGAKIKRVTRELKKSALERCRDDLTRQLQALADTPTPSYREWREMVSR